MTTSLASVANLDQQRRRIDEARAKIDKGGEPPDDGGMLKRVEKLEADVSTILVDVATIRSNYATKADIAEIRTDMHKATTDIQRWMIATIIGLFLGFGGLFMAMSNSLKPSNAAAAAPIIITIPGQPGTAPAGELRAPPPPSK